MTPAAGDTWGIPGPTFLVVYGALVAGTAATAFVLRRWFGPTQVAAGPSLSPAALALAAGGERLAVTTALGQLRAAGLVDEYASPTVRITPGLIGDRLNAVVMEELARDPWPRSAAHLAVRPGVRQVLAGTTTELVRRGYLATSGEILRCRVALVAVGATAVLGIVRTGFGLARGRPVGYVVAETFVATAIVVVLLVIPTPRTTPAARRELQRLRAANSHLAFAMKPAWQTYGPAAAGLSIALWGVAALSIADPAFAALVDPLTTTAGGWNAAGGGSAFTAGGSSCGGGGGGCGGGGGGGCGG